MPLHSSKKTVVHVAAEVEPLYRTGGLGIVVSALARAQEELGHAVQIIAPYYPGLMKLEHPPEFLGEGFVEFGDAKVKVGWYRTQLRDWKVPVYLISHPALFAVQKPYAGKRVNERYYCFCAAAVELLRAFRISPDIIHCHDWHAGLVPHFLKTYSRGDLLFKNTSTVFTIHNLTFQLGRNWWEIPQEERDDGYESLPAWHEKKELASINFAKRGILSADVISTVSETYREEIMTKDFGQDLHRILKNREALVYGIVNGIDYEEFNPLTDPGIHTHYSEKSASRKAANKRWLQRRLKFTRNPRTPLLCSTSRIVEQKGFKLLQRILLPVLRTGAQVVMMGDGDEEMIRWFEKIARQFPRQFAILPFDANFETSLYAGADMFLLPSRFEPCGINQLIALRYGCIPIVHHIGGLADTINDYDPHTGKGNGFIFRRYNSRDFLAAIIRAIENFKHTRSWRKLVISSMREAFSWRLQAGLYIDLYTKAEKIHRRSRRKNLRQNSRPKA